MKSMHSLRVTASVAVLALVAACSDTPAPVQAPDLSPSLERSERAQERLAALFPETSADVLDLPGTVYADHNERTGKLEFGIERAEIARGVEARLRARGLAEGEFEIRVVPAIRNMATLQNVNDAQVRAGTQIHFGQYVCTLGFNVRVNGADGFITNSHCTNTQGGVESTNYHMPIRTTGAPAEAIEVADPTYSKGGGCSPGKKCRRSDASRAVYQTATSGTSAAFGKIAAPAAPNTGSLDIFQTFTIGSTDESTTSFPLGTTLNKIGRTTGWGQGVVTSSCVNVNVSGSNIQQLCQTIVESTSGATIVSGGDSGSPVFTSPDANGNVKLVGILWGGGGTTLFVFSPLKNVRSEITGNWIAN